MVKTTPYFDKRCFPGSNNGNASAGEATTLVSNYLDVSGKWPSKKGILNYYNLLSGTDDFIRHTSQVVNPVCPQRFVPSFHVLLLGTSILRSFHKMQRHSVDAVDCSAQCCESPDCLLSFIDDNKCYGVTGNPVGKNFTAQEQERTLSLQVAIVDRNKG